MGRAAGRRVDRQARSRDPAGRRRAARRRGRVRRRSGVRVPAQRRRPRRALDAGDRRARRRRPPDADARHARPRRPRPDLLPGGVRGRGRRVGARDQPVRPAQRPGGQGQHQASARWRARSRSSRAGDDDELRALLGDAGPPHYVAIMGYLPPSDELDAAIAELRDRDPRGDRRGDDVRLRPAVPALDRSAAQGRAAPMGRFLQLRQRPQRRRRDPGRGVLVRDADRRAGGRRPADAALARAARRAGQARRGPGRGRARADRADRRATRTGADADADRVRRAGQDGREHGAPDPAATPTTRSSRSTSAHDAVKAAESHGASGAGSLEELVQKLEAPQGGLDHGAGRGSDAADGRDADRR